MKLISDFKTPTMLVSSTASFTVVGKSFLKLTNVYLSGTPFANVATLINPFSGVPGMSADFPGFYGIRLPASAYNTNYDTLLSCTVTNPTLTGYFDIILENPAGYGSLIHFTKNNTFNPYVSGTPQYKNYVPYTSPWSKGIKVIKSNQF